MCTPAWAAEFQPGQFFSVAAEQEVPSRQAFRTNLFSGFATRLKMAIENRDAAAIKILYQTNGVTPEELDREFARWPGLFGGESKPGASCYFKELAALPPKARVVWSSVAQGLTKHDATHLVLVRIGTDLQLTLPLVVVDDQLLILPSYQGAEETHSAPTGPLKLDKSAQR